MAHEPYFSKKIVFSLKSVEKKRIAHTFFFAPIRFFFLKNFSKNFFSLKRLEMAQNVPKKIFSPKNFGPPLGPLGTQKSEKLILGH